MGILAVLSQTVKWVNVRVIRKKQIQEILT